MKYEIVWQDTGSWQAGFADALAGRRSPMGDPVAYRSGHLQGSAQRMSRRTMMAAAVAALASIPAASALAETPKSDPIFAAIEQHRRAWQALNGAAEDDDHGLLHETVLEAEAKVVNTSPMTAAGVLAVRAYHRELRERGGIGQPARPPGFWRPGKG